METAKYLAVGRIWRERKGVERTERERGRERPLRKPHIHDYKLRLTLLSGVERSERPVNERGRLMGLIYVQFGNRTDRYETPYQGRGREKGTEYRRAGRVLEAGDLGFRE